MDSAKNWVVYILQCSDNSLYTGITKDISRRLEEHNTGREAAKYTRARRPVKLVYQESVTDHSSALKREREIKKMPASHKRDLVTQAAV
ncbi:MAG: GIY-YIG nuclease family protein [Gammaproteobacteria bacterium]|nr:GIY-YIG nuclease family protein [Gammaproteobacteria bacterium]